jgi:hypothetical protein
MSSPVLPETLRALPARGHERKGAQHLHGRANLSITLDRYGHPMPGNEDEAAALLDGYLARSMADAGRAALVAAA